MNGAVVYYSKWGNCKRVAEGISRGLYETGHNVKVIDAGSFEGVLDKSLDFIAIGSPTRGNRMAGPIKKFIKLNMDDGWKDKPAAAFGTGMKISTEKGKPKSAADIFRVLSENGLELIAPSFQAKVAAAKGPLDDGEAARSIEFGKELGESLKDL